MPEWRNMEAQRAQLPETTRRRLNEFRSRVRRIKFVEGILAGLFGLALSYVAVFVLDRFFDTSAVVRSGLLFAGALGLGLFFPLKCHRWIWGTRRMEQVARLVQHRFPALGDQLLSVVELASAESDLGSSASLTNAAIAHVDSVVRDRDLSDAVPEPQHRRWTVAAAVPIALMIVALMIVPAAGRNALLRWLIPWSDTDRYTFAQIDDLPDTMVVPHGEEFSLSTRLKDSTEWSPKSGTAAVGKQARITTTLDRNGYLFQLPPQTHPGQLHVRIGDIRESVAVRPETRPELTSMRATVRLPAYLQYSHDVMSDVRGGAISLVKGAVAKFEAHVSRSLSEAKVTGASASIDGDRILTEELPVEESKTVDFHWRDELGLSAKDTFRLKVRAVEDQEPSISCQQNETLQVVLSTDVITFDLSAIDDFGVREIGLEWQGIPDPLRNPNPESGSKVVSPGGPENIQLDAVATFSADNDKVRPQSLTVRAYAEDFQPERGRVYSPACVLHVMTPQDHAIWMAEQLRRWASRADDVYEEEMRLHDVNRELRRMGPQDIRKRETQKRIQQQAAAERSNAARLGMVTDQGKQLIDQAFRNREMLVGHLETLARSVQKLEEIASRRMPSVADLLEKSARAVKKTSVGQPTSAKSGPTAGNDRNQQSGKPGESKPGNPTAKVPGIVDRESGWEKSQETDQENSESPPGKPRLTLPTTNLSGGPPSKGAPPPPPPPPEIDEAVEEQADLLAEFEKIREELQSILDDLENSTFVKRFKAASRRQLEVAGDLNRTLFRGFGIPAAQRNDRQKQQAEKIAQREEAQSQFVWTIQSDLKAYFGRKQEERFQTILSEMDELQVVPSLGDLGSRVRRNLSGESISRAEYWADTLDRWGEELVRPAPGGC